MSTMRAMAQVCVATGLLILSGGAHSQVTASSDESSREGTLPLTQLISMVAKKAGKTFIVDPRVSGNVLIIGKDPAAISYPDFLTVLQVHGFTAMETKGYTRIVPDANARQLPTPIVTGNESHPDAEFVSRIIEVKNVPAMMLVPILRPLLPQQAHLVAVACNNTLVIVDTFGNVKRIENIVRQLDIGDPYKPEKCAARESAAASDSARKT